jgi:hypothetical protein
LQTALQPYGKASAKIVKDVLKGKLILKELTFYSAT